MSAETSPLAAKAQLSLDLWNQLRRDALNRIRTSTPVTISGGAISVQKAYNHYVISAESGTDDILDTIANAGGAGQVGDIITIAANPGHVIRVKANTAILSPFQYTSIQWYIIGDDGGINASASEWGRELTLVCVADGQWRVIDDTAGLHLPPVFEARLSIDSPLTSTVEAENPNVTTSNSSIWLLPYLGNRVFVADSNQVLYGFHMPRGTGQVTLSLSGLAVGLYDILLGVNDTTGLLELTRSNAWTNNTTRSQAVVWDDGGWLRHTATGRLVVGTIYINSTGTCTDSFLIRGLSNFFNRIQKPLYRTDATSHTYGTAANRPWNNDATQAVTFVNCKAQFVTAVLSGDISSGAAGSQAYIVFIDTVTAGQPSITATHFLTTQARVVGVSVSPRTSPQAAGLATYQVNEYSASASPASTFHGYHASVLAEF